jgi:hypothetical protein
MLFNQVGQVGGPPSDQKMPVKICRPGSDKLCGKINRYGERVAPSAQDAIQSLYSCKMECRIQAGQGTKRTLWPISDGIQARPFASDHNQSVNLGAQRICDMIQQASAPKLRRCLVCAKTACLPTGDDGAKNPQLFYPTFNAKAAQTAARIIAITSINGHGMNPTASGFLRFARRRSPHVASPAIASAVTQPLQSTCCNRRSFQAKAAAIIESRG